MQHLTRRQQEIYQYLCDHLPDMPHPPTLDELCDALGLKSRGSLHKQIHALIDAGLVEPMHNLRRGIRLSQNPTKPTTDQQNHLPLYGSVAAGQPIEAINNPDTMEVPAHLHTSKPCYVLQIQGDSMLEVGILDGDWVIIEQREHARNGEIVVALVNEQDATLKRWEKQGQQITLHPANRDMPAMHYPASQVRIQGVLVGQMRKYN